MSEDRPQTPAPEADDKAPNQVEQDGRLYLAPPKDGAHAQALVELSWAYNRGDLYAARSGARQVLAGDPNEAERSFAAEILRRTAFDPAALAVGLGSLVLFVVIIVVNL